MNATERNGLHIERIAPKLGAKFSPNLYRWLKSKDHGHRAWTSRLFLDSAGNLWIGMYDPPLRELIGSRLLGVLCNGVQEQAGAWQCIDAVEIEGFWDRYMADGRCAIDVLHTMKFKGDDSRWRVQDDRRSCLWCGRAQQVMKRWTETVQRAEWTAAPALEDVKSCNADHEQERQCYALDTATSKT
ncbi:hypothetical protein [Acidovorax carolinensis]|uniref:hypothetical protein n=1 Tax=Acidovorax carolinensis TaxID=553814 RepID=UPI0019520052|nr:hypothetical protein [Acidovorax carolinensis]